MDKPGPIIIWQIIMMIHIVLQFVMWIGKCCFGGFDKNLKKIIFLTEPFRRWCGNPLRLLCGSDIGYNPDFDWTQDWIRRGKF